MKLCGIYLITNLSNGKKYIGKSIDILTRWEQHIDAARLKKKDYEFYQDMTEVQNFSFQILELCTLEELQEKEQHFIKYFNSLEQGYNQVMAIDLSKEEQMLFDKKIQKAIELLETTGKYYHEIAEETGLSENIISNINRCKSHTNYHNYKNNIREECGRKQYENKGELNPRSKLTTEQVLEIVELLKHTNLSAEEIGKRYGVSKTTISNINLRGRWTHLTVGFDKNIRKEYQQNYQRKG